MDINLRRVSELNDSSFRLESMSATQFTADLEDIRFVLFDQLNIDEKLVALPKFADFDRELYDATLQEALRISQEVLHPINGPGDRQGCRLDGEGNVTTPDGYKAAWDVIAEGGWMAISPDPEVGGMGLPSSVAMAVGEMFSGAAMAFNMYPGLTAAAARLLAKAGPPGKSVEYARRMFSGQWGGTMCLTEAGAGSSVGDNRCKAVRTDEDGVYHLVGEKIFISGADQDLSENIIHLVLARTVDAPSGTRGLSLFLVPKFLVNDAYESGDRNDAYVVGIEEKMGIHGSATCTLALGANGTCKAWILGEEGEGMALMFHMMNEARIGVGSQGLAVAAASYQYALGYARERLQGVALENWKDASADRVAIIQHPDVRRMLMTMRVSVQAMRSMLFRLAHRFDMAEHGDAAARERLIGRVELLTPVLKAHCTDTAFEVAVAAVQVFGGYGYIGEYPVEQLVRDGKIMSIYEGTNGIQAMDLVGRKMRMNGGSLFMEWVTDAQALLKRAVEADLADEAEAVGKAVNSVAAAAMHLGGLGMQGRLEGAMVGSHPFLEAFGVTALALECVDQAVIAQRLIAERGETRQLRGKRRNLEFYVAHVLPRATALSKTVRSGDESCLDPEIFEQ